MSRTGVRPVSSAVTGYAREIVDNGQARRERRVLLGCKRRMSEGVSSSKSPLHRITSRVNPPPVAAAWGMHCSTIVAAW